MIFSPSSQVRLEKADDQTGPVRGATPFGIFRQPQRRSEKQRGRTVAATVAQDPNLPSPSLVQGNHLIDY